MAAVSISGGTADLKLAEGSPMARSGLSHLTIPVVSDLSNPIDETTLERAELGVTLSSPSILIGNAGILTIQDGETGRLVVRKASDKKLFEDDDLSVSIPIGADECWIGFALETSVDGNLSASVDGFGVGVDVIPNVSFGTYALLQRSAGEFPTLMDGLKTVLERFSVTYTPDSVRALRPGTVNVAEMGGTVKFTGSYSLPVTVNALASAALPFNSKIQLNPAEPLKITGQIALTGDFIVRCHKVTDDKLEMGVYKKRGTTFTATLTAKAGVEGDIGTTDVISAALSAVLPGVDPGKSGITGEDAEAIRRVLNDCIDRSLSIGMNVSCSAAYADEAAIVYSIDLTGGSSIATNAAISSALRGDWTAVDQLPNARSIRNIIRDTRDSKHRIAFNLLGIYNAASLDDYIRSCTILRDEHGVTIIDRAKATHVATAATPYAADPDKLRKALVEGFLTTMTYTAAASQAGLTASQRYFRYADNMPQSDMQDQIRLGKALNLIQDEHWDQILQTTPSLRHVKVTAGAAYDHTAALQLFFSDVSGRTPRGREELERIGRDVMASLIDSSRPPGKIRTGVLQNDALWAAMDENGNVQSFQATIPGLQQLGITDVAAVSADWTDVAWWAEAVVQVAGKLRDLLRTVDPNPTDPNFMKKRKALEDTLAKATSNSRAAFADGWGLAVMFAVSGGAGTVSMDIAWNSTSEHSESTPKVAAAP